MTLSVVILISVCTQAVDFYLQDRYSKEREEIIKISRSTDFTEVEKEKLMGYIREAISMYYILLLSAECPCTYINLGINHPLGAWRRASSNINIPVGGGLPEISVREGEMIFMDFKKALGVNDVCIVLFRRGIDRMSLTYLCLSQP